MKRITIGIVSALVSFETVAAAEAQESTWKYNASVYLFMPETSTAIGTPRRTFDAELSFDDTLKNLDAAFMAAIEANNGKWSFIGDYMITNIEFDKTPAIPVLSRAQAEVQTQIFSGYALYKLYETQKLSMGVGAGYRWYSTDTDIKLTGAGGNALSFGVDKNWVNALIAARVNVDFSDHWSGRIFADYGGFESNDNSWQILATANYEIRNKWLLRGGYRHIEVEHEIGGQAYSFEQSGPILGIAYQF